MIRTDNFSSVSFDDCFSTSYIVSLFFLLSSVFEFYDANIPSITGILSFWTLAFVRGILKSNCFAFMSRKFYCIGAVKLLGYLTDGGKTSDYAAY